MSEMCNICGGVGNIHAMWCRNNEKVEPVKAAKYQIGGDHYMNMAIQPWDAMKSWLPPEQFIGFLRGNALKYLARAGNKGSDSDDYKKALHYLEALREFKLSLEHDDKAAY